MVNKGGQLAEEHKRGRTFSDSTVPGTWAQSTVETIDLVCNLQHPDYLRSRLAVRREGVYDCRVALKRSAADRSSYKVGLKEQPTAVFLTKGTTASMMVLTTYW
jgi:hypothetical protein